MIRSEHKKFSGNHIMSCEVKFMFIVENFGVEILNSFEIPQDGHNHNEFIWDPSLMDSFLFSRLRGKSFAKSVSTDSGLETIKLFTTL
jgi:hypothetical protein